MAVLEAPSKLTRYRSNSIMMFLKTVKTLKCLQNLNQNYKGYIRDYSNTSIFLMKNYNEISLLVQKALHDKVGYCQRGGYSWEWFAILRVPALFKKFE